MLPRGCLPELALWHLALVRGKGAVVASALLAFDDATDDDGSDPVGRWNSLWPDRAGSEGRKRSWWERWNWLIWSPGVH